MAANTSDRNRWLLDAEDEAGDNVDDQITWLREQRRTYAEAIRAGDWEHNQITNEGGTTTMKRGVSDQANHDAIVAALNYLGVTDLGDRPGIIIANFGEILN